MEEMEEEAEEEEEEEETREVRWRAAFPSDHRHYPRHRRPSRGAVTMALLPSFSTYFFFTRVDRGLAHSASTCSSSSSSSYSDDDGDPVRPRSLRTGSLACYRVCLFVGLFVFFWSFLFCFWCCCCSCWCYGVSERGRTRPPNGFGVCVLLARVSAYRLVAVECAPANVSARRCARTRSVSTCPCP